MLFFDLFMLQNIKCPEFQFDNRISRCCHRFYKILFCSGIRQLIQVPTSAFSVIMFNKHIEMKMRDFVNVTLHTIIFITHTLISSGNFSFNILPSLVFQFLPSKYLKFEISMLLIFSSNLILTEYSILSNQSVGL